jgi:hypothetical protein
MKDNSKNGFFGLSSNFANELADCLVYEAFWIIEEAAEARQRLGEKAEDIFSSQTFKNEDELRQAAEAGLREGQKRAFPKEMGPDALHYGFVAEMVSMEIGGSIRYVEGVGWEVWDGESWQRRPKERGIAGLIYEVMKQKINIWRKALENKGRSVRGTGGWLEKLEKNINDPDWLSKVEELLLRVDYFGVEIVSGNGERQG